MSLDHYQDKVVKPLIKLEKQGKGELFDLTDSVKGFRKGDDPKILITACYHAPEIYATYESVLKLAEKSKHDLYLIPVVDAERFQEAAERSDSGFSDFDKSWHATFVNDYIQGYNTRPDVLQWEFGKKKAKSPIPELEALVAKSDLFIDLHNSCIPGYILITEMLKGEEEFFKKIADYITKRGKLSKGNIGLSFKPIGEGLYSSINPNTVTSFAKKNKTTNLVLEIPTFDERFNLRDFKKTMDFNNKLLAYILNQYKISGGKK